MKKLPAENALVTALHSPSRATLLKTIGIVLAVALLLLTLVVLPAEYGIDVTGLGGRLGLTRLYQEGVGVSGGSIHTSHENSYRTDQVEVTLRPEEGLEYKFILDQGAMMVYSWQADGLLYYDFHGEPEGDTSGYFESYSATVNLEANGSFNAPFEGRHGWYWRNRGDQAVTLTLSTAGYYEVLGVP
jgi:hypothetical protein